MTEVRFDTFYPPERERAQALVGKTITAVRCSDGLWDDPDLLLVFSDGSTLRVDATGAEAEGVACVITDPG